MIASFMLIIKSLPSGYMSSVLVMRNLSWKLRLCWSPQLPPFSFLYFFSLSVPPSASLNAVTWLLDTATGLGTVPATTCLHAIKHYSKCISSLCTPLVSFLLLLSLLHCSKACISLWNIAHRPRGCEFNVRLLTQVARSRWFRSHFNFQFWFLESHASW